MAIFRNVEAERNDAITMAAIAFDGNFCYEYLHSVIFTVASVVILTFKLVVLLKRKQDQTDQEFAKYWLERHALLAKKMPGLRKYVVNVVRCPPNREPDYNGIVELWFDDIESMKKALASSEGQATQKNTETFTSKVTTLYIDEHNVI